jgi:hypothetical protein
MGIEMVKTIVTGRVTESISTGWQGIREKGATNRKLVAQINVG